MNITEYIRQWADRIEATMAKLLPGEDVEPPVIHRAMRYSSLGGGKRLRGILAVSACRAAGGREETALPLAAALEMIHAYSLVHDDLPCMDDDDMRRGKPANHKVFGEAMAVLAGDALLTRGFWVLGRLPELTGVAGETALAILREVSEAAGTSGLIGGQVLDVEAEGRAAILAVEHLEGIHRRKTGALFRASVLSGALLGGAPAEKLQPFAAYAEALGLLFQIVDDILDVVGDARAMGKGVGRDRRRDKATYPALLGLDGAQEMARREAERALEAARELGAQGDVLGALVEYVHRRDR
ncbi:MAG: polyprenyl synthetase family protein [Firmicutes bacterium]|nr:polyprenyl synthetase family protein [Bacillota bacterium]